MLLERSERAIFILGMDLNLARSGYRNENRSNAMDAQVIADRLDSRRTCMQELRPCDEALSKLRAPVSDRRGWIGNCQAALRREILAARAKGHPR